MRTLVIIRKNFSIRPCPESKFFMYSITLKFLQTNERYEHNAEPRVIIFQKRKLNEKSTSCKNNQFRQIPSTTTSGFEALTRLFELRPELKAFVTDNSFNLKGGLHDQIWLFRLYFLADIFQKINDFRGKDVMILPLF